MMRFSPVTCTSSLGLVALAFTACVSVSYKDGAASSSDSASAAAAGGDGGAGGATSGGGGVGGAGGQGGAEGPKCDVSTDCVIGQVCEDKHCRPLIEPLVVDAGDRFTCALMSDKTVRCWGAVPGSAGVDEDRFVPKTFSLGAGTPKAIAVNGRSVCIEVDDAGDRRIRCAWDGQTSWASDKLSPPSTSMPAIDVGRVFVNDAAACWYGGSDILCYRAKADDIIAVKEVQASADAAGSRLCYVEEGAVTCVTINSGSKQPIKLTSAPPLRQIYVSDSHFCATDTNGFLCDALNGEAPSLLTHTGNIKVMAVGSGSTCYVEEGSSKIQCSGKLEGDIEIPTGRTITQLTLGTKYGCGLFLIEGATPEMECWGDNTDAQLGTGSVGGSSPVLVPVSLPAVDPATGGSKR